MKIKDDYIETLNPQVKRQEIVEKNKFDINKETLPPILPYSEVDVQTPVTDVSIEIVDNTVPSCEINAKDGEANQDYENENDLDYNPESDSGKAIKYQKIVKLMPYPCSHFYVDIKFGNRLYSKEKRRP